ncbi:MAG: hypothetical protein RSE39_08375, partial [Oscillospiraceae bacterium]
DIKLFTNLNDEYCHRIFNHLKEISKYKGYLDKKNKVNMKIFIEYFHINVDKVSNAVQEIKKNYDVDKLGVINCKEI